MLKFSIITPTVQRDSLVKNCQSIDEQHHLEWEHIVVIDSAELNDELIFSLAHPKRKFIQCDKPHRNSGNTCRHNGWDHASGDYTYYLDDDNYLYSPNTLRIMSQALEEYNRPAWGLFPILRHGSIFFFDPPQPCYFDTGNAVVHNDYSQWPDIPDYASDAVWLQQFKDLPYQAFSNFEPVMVMPGTSFGAGGGINGQ